MSDFRFRSALPLVTPAPVNYDLRFPLAETNVNITITLGGLSGVVYVTDPDRIEEFNLTGTLPLPTFKAGVYTPTDAYIHDPFNAQGEPQLLLWNKAPQSTRLTFNNPINPTSVIPLTFNGTLPQLTMLAGVQDAAVNFDVVGTLPPLTLTATVLPVAELNVTGAFPGLQMIAEAEYRTNTQRPTVGQSATLHQIASKVQVGPSQPQQDAGSAPVGWEAFWAMGGYGLYVQLEHGNELQTRYGHMSRLNVAEGQHVRKGDVIGFVGSTGRSTGPHLHYEVRVGGAAVNPIPYMQSDRVSLASIGN
jgi:hypothetical protein